MPVNTPYYNGTIDPLLPSVIKPILYMFDEYQTYDLVYEGNFVSALTEPDNNYINYIPHQGALIERFSPLKVPSHLLTYTDHLANFLTPFKKGLPTVDPYHPEVTPIFVSQVFASVVIDPKIPIIIKTENINEQCYLWYLYHEPDNFLMPEYNWRRINLQQFKGKDFIIDLELEPYPLLYSFYVQCLNANITESVENDIISNSESWLFSNINELASIADNYKTLNSNWDKITYISGIGADSLITATIPNFYFQPLIIYANNNIWDQPEAISNNSDTVCYFQNGNISTYPLLYQFTMYNIPLWLHPNSMYYESLLYFGDYPEVNGEIIYSNTYTHKILRTSVELDPAYVVMIPDAPTSDEQKNRILAEIATNQEVIDFADSNHYNNEFLTTGENNMPDSIRLKELHAALDAQYFAYDPNDQEKARIANLGYYIERIARVLGISVNPDGSIRSIRNSVRIDQDKVIPSGWNFAQFGLNAGGNTNPNNGQIGGKSTEIRDGIVYELKSNALIKDGVIDKIQAGGYVLVENIPQFIHILMADLDRALGLQELGAFPLPTPNGGYEVYEGLHNVVTDIAYMISQLSDNITQTHVLGLKNNALLLETLRAMGLAIGTKKIPITVDGKKSVIVNPAISEESLTLADFLFMILNNLSLLVGSSITPTVTDE